MVSWIVVLILALAFQVHGQIKVPLPVRKHLSSSIVMELNKEMGDPMCSLITPFGEGNGFETIVGEDGVPGGEPLRLTGDYFALNGKVCDIDKKDSGIAFPSGIPDFLPHYDGDVLSDYRHELLIHPSSTLSWVLYGDAYVLGSRKQDPVPPAFRCPHENATVPVRIQRMLMWEFSSDHDTGGNNITSLGKVMYAMVEISGQVSGMGSMRENMKCVYARWEDLKKERAAPKRTEEREETDDDSGIAISTIIGIVAGGIGIFIGVAVVVVAAILMRRRKDYNEDSEGGESDSMGQNSGVESSHDYHNGQAEVDATSHEELRSAC